MVARNGSPVSWLVEQSRCIDTSFVPCSNPWWTRERCWLEVWRDQLERHAPRDAVHEQLKDSLRRCIEMGYTLRTRLPHLQQEQQDEWLGRRWIWMHRSQWHCRQRWIAWCSSRLGRHANQRPDWPRWLSAQMSQLLRGQRRTGHQLDPNSDSKLDQAWQLLVVPGTTLYPWTRPLVQRAGLGHVQVELPERRVALDDWLAEQIQRTLQSNSDGWAIGTGVPTTTAQADRIWLSPSLALASPSMESHPLQDRISIACSDRVVALSLRSGGTVPQLVSARLLDHRFPSGSVHVALASHVHHPASDMSSWLERGAVGWHLLPGHSTTASQGRRVSSSNCHHPHASETLGAGLVIGTQQLHTRVDLFAWDRFLVHCVRGDQGKLASHADDSHALSVWWQGESASATALETLLRIVHSKRLRGSPSLGRARRASVSLSEVPLPDLLARRKFQSHLGRWDWEPYGLLIHREALRPLGCRPVIYGEEADYERLSLDEQPYFQPIGRRGPASIEEGLTERMEFESSGEQRGWEVEREWRLVGDVRLADLSQGCLWLFVSNRVEAQQLARVSPWPIIWLKAETPLVRPSRKVQVPVDLGRTSRN